jgi:hypothetical protein
MDPILNCLTTACCPPEERAAVLAKYLKEEGIDTPEKFSAWLFKNCDVAPAGTLQPLVQAIAKLARGADYKE